MKKLIEYNQSRKHVSKVALNESVASSRMSSKTKPKKSKDFISMNKKLDQSRKENKSIGSQDQMNKYLSQVSDPAISKGTKVARIDLDIGDSAGLKIRKSRNERKKQSDTEMTDDQIMLMDLL